MTISFRVARIPKGRGKYREIYIASKQDRLALRCLLPQLQETHTRCDSTSTGYAFLIGRNCALMALQHIGHRFTLSMDLENFFESITPRHVEDVLTPALIDYCFIDGRLRQGLPTSPVISNIAFCPFDRAIIVALQVLKLDAVYTRYADDLVFSYADASIGGKIQTVVRQIVGRGGFKVNEQKTSIQSAKNGRIVVAGIALDASGLHATRKTRRKIRAALHQGNEASAAGLVEWSKCKLPNVIFSSATADH
jgi:RNA-directed DNA polymerase